MKKEELYKKLLPRRIKEYFVLILFNDDTNTFDHVIKSLVEVCGHDEFQAEQCAMIAHFKGSCEIKTGSKSTLNSMCKSLTDRDLIVKVVRF